uniref:Membrane protein m39 n=1 Tax=Mastomys natalensis cytomegalovirus 1 TaxID=2973541 RepID=A0A9Y1IJG3_9BETA|nr:membrane protein m39 [Mastomys natalensis cytomegalovirus 1]
MHSFRVAGPIILSLLIIGVDISYQWKFEYKCPNETDASTSHTICCGRCDHMSYTSCQVNVPILLAAVFFSFVFGILTVVISDMICSLRCTRGYADRVLSAFRWFLPGLDLGKSRLGSRRNVQLNAENIDGVLASEMNSFNGTTVIVTREDDNYDGISEACHRNVTVHNF